MGQEGDGEVGIILHLDVYWNLMDLSYHRTLFGIMTDS